MLEHTSRNAHDPAMTSSNNLELQRVTGQDSPAAPVAGIDLSVESGQTLVLLGSARAGKSSLQRLIAGFGVVEGGHIIFNGHDLRELAPHKRPFTLLTEQDALFPHLTIAKNVAYGLKSRKLARPERDHRVANCLEVVGLQGLEKAYPHALSPAERQLAALARALAVQPLVLLLDEALSQLDPIHSGRILANLRALQRQVGMTIILATTNSSLAMGLADKLAILHEGRLIDLDRPDALYRAPRSALTARLTGPVNLVPGDVLRSYPGQPSTKAFAEVREAGAQWALALRPDQLEIHLIQPPDQVEHLEGHVERLAYSPAGLAAQIRIVGLHESLIARVDSGRLDADDLSEGRRVWCTWDDEAAHAVPL
jgi:ABC-type Fe3+/spermidine/putrescine transport system ATPase subunit